MKLYRAVSPQELADIRSYRGLRPIPSSLQGKWFAETPEHAAEWGRKLFQPGSFHLWTWKFHKTLPTKCLESPARQDWTGQVR